MSQNQNRTWLGSIAAAVKALMSFLMAIIDVGNEGIAMADIAVKSAREKQAIDLTISQADYASTALQKAAVTSATNQEALNEFVKGNQVRQENVSAAHKRLTALVEAELARIKASRLA